MTFSQLEVFNCEGTHPIEMFEPSVNSRNSLEKSGYTSILYVHVCAGCQMLFVPCYSMNVDFLFAQGRSEDALSLQIDV